MCHQSEAPARERLWLAVAFHLPELLHIVEAANNNQPLPRNQVRNSDRGRAPVGIPESPFSDSPLFACSSNTARANKTDRLPD